MSVTVHVSCCVYQAALTGLAMALPVVVLHPSCCALAFATAQADLGAFTVDLPQIGAVSGDVPSPLALVA